MRDGYHVANQGHDNFSQRETEADSAFGPLLSYHQPGVRCNAYCTLEIVLSGRHNTDSYRSPYTFYSQFSKCFEIISFADFNFNLRT